MGEITRYCPACGSDLWPLARTMEFFCDHCERVSHIMDLGLPTSQMVAEIRAGAHRRALAGKVDNDR